MSFKGFSTLALTTILFSGVERTILAILVKVHKEKHLCEIILKSGHWA